MYNWRKLSEKQRADVMEYRRIQRFPMHSPPHFDTDESRQFIVTAANYEHKHIVGKTPERMFDCTQALLAICCELEVIVYAWCLLPNHYHILLTTNRIKELRQAIGRFNGKSSFIWNGEDGARGRKVWHNCFERKMRSERHYFASLNYVLNNAVHHGYVKKWQDWPWSNANEYLENVGRGTARRIWTEYPILDYGSKWDIF